uniref:Uncharacterized protein n=1 Tax=Triticum urartu TaxID=4572 RepID=A0A8R7Q955_TRIUA
MKPHTPITNAQETMNFLSCYALVGGDWLSDIFELQVIYNFDQDYNLKDFKTSTYLWVEWLKGTLEYKWICLVSWSRPVIMMKAPPRLKKANGYCNYKSIWALAWLILVVTLIG